jgi:uncharacterized protein
MPRTHQQMPAQVHLHDAAAQAWRNGGGSTRELLAWPHAEYWQLRVSVATIAHSGAFSSFPDITRWLVVLQGNGVKLHLASGSRSLVCGDPPLQFDGEEAPHCHLLDGPTLDLNFMAQRHAGSPQMAAAHAGSDLGGSTTWRALYAADAAVLDLDGVATPLAGGTLLWSDSPDSSDWHLRQAGRAWWLSWQAP